MKSLPIRTPAESRSRPADLARRAAARAGRDATRLYERQVSATLVVADEFNDFGKIDLMESGPFRVQENAG
jgi:hypothetical protein